MQQSHVFFTKNTYKRVNQTIVENWEHFAIMIRKQSFHWLKKSKSVKGSELLPVELADMQWTFDRITINLEKYWPEAENYSIITHCLQIPPFTEVS